MCKTKFVAFSDFKVFQKPSLNIDLDLKIPYLRVFENNFGKSEILKSPYDTIQKITTFVLIPFGTLFF